MKHCIILLIACIFLFQSCNRAKTKKGGNVLEIDSEHLEDVKLSDYVDNLKIVKLETSDEVRTGEIMKVQIFDGKIYVLD